MNVTLSHYFTNNKLLCTAKQLSKHRKGSSFENYITHNPSVYGSTRMCFGEYFHTLCSVFEDQ